MSDAAGRIKIAFLGSGAIAVPVLQALLNDSRISVDCVVTQPDRPAGRRRTPTPTPVGALAEYSQTAVAKVPDINAPIVVDLLRNLSCDMFVVVSFGQILRSGILELAPKGVLNVHASMLPKYRGASPIAAAIAAGEAEAGVTFMDVELGLDCGGIYDMLSLPIAPDDTTESLTDKLGHLAASRIGDVVCGIAAGKLCKTPQDESLATMTRKIRKEHGRMNWRCSAAELDRLVRSCIPWPTAFFVLRNPETEETLTVSVESVKISDEFTGVCQPGEMLRCDKKGWIIGTGNGALEIVSMVIPGRKSMPGAAFWNGNAKWRNAVIDLE